jgi:ribonuclease BN (tRNA processing enzyme)
MIFAPRSWPSSPGFAITTRIFAATVGQYRNVKLIVVGCSPAWPNPGGAQSGYLVEHEGRRVLLDCGPGVLPRLRTFEDWPHVDAIAITHFHLDHWGDLVPWVWALEFGPAADMEPPELWVPPNGRATLARLGSDLGRPEMFEAAFRLREYEDGTPFQAAGFEIVAHRVVHYAMLAYGFRVAQEGVVLGYSGDCGPNGGLTDIARDADLFLCEATLQEPAENGVRGHLAPEEARAAADAAGAKRLLLTHRPDERPLDAAFELVYDGFELDL